MTDIISLTSSEDEGTPSAPRVRKKRRIVPLNLSQVSLSIVERPKKVAELTDTVVIDSEDEEQCSEPPPKQLKLNGVLIGTSVADEIQKQPGPNVKEINKLITSSLLAVDGSVAVNVQKEENESKEQKTEETVTLEDSDTDIEAIDTPVTQEQKPEEPELKLEESNKNIVAEVINENVSCNSSPLLPLGQSGSLKSTTTVDPCCSKSLNTIEEPCNPQSINTHEELTMKSEELCEESSTPIPSKNTETLTNSKSLCDEFISLLQEKLKKKGHSDDICHKKLAVLNRYFKKYSSYVSSESFVALLSDNIANVKKASASDRTVIIALHKVYTHLKSRLHECAVEVEEDDLPKVKKMEKKLALLRHRIKQLEEAEVVFEEGDDDNSAYILLDKYLIRFNKIYDKYCQYIRRNPFSGRATHERISFVHSKYNVINQALSKKYRNSLKFPTYYELEQFIERTVKDTDLNLSMQEIKSESKKCFAHLGNMIQKKRKQDLYDVHLDFIESSEDPANIDAALDAALRTNLTEGQSKMNKTFQEFVDKQEKVAQESTENNEDTSEDTCDSESEDDTDQPKGD